MRFLRRLDWKNKAEGKPETIVYKDDLLRYENGIGNSYDALNTAAANTSRLLCKLARGLDPAHMLVVGDSTGNEPSEHVYLEAIDLGKQFPRYTVHYRLWNDTSRVYAAPVVIQTGTGDNPPVLTIWNASVSGFSPLHFIAERYPQITDPILATPPDLIMISHAHNMFDVTTPNLRASFQPNMLVLTEELTRTFPAAGVIVMSQNPEFVAPRETWMNIKATEAQDLCARRGYGFIDVHQAFLDTGNPRDYVQSDGVHPTTSGEFNGSRLWADTVMGALTYRGAVSSLAQGISYFDRPAKSLITNTEFADWTGTEPMGWTASLCTVEKDTVNYETGFHGMKITATADGTAVAQMSFVPNAVGLRGLVSGQVLTFGVRVFVPDTNKISSVGISLRDQFGASQQRRNDISSSARGRFHWVYATKRIAFPANSIVLQISPQWSGANDGTHTMTVDRVRLIPGDLPLFG